MYSTKRRRIFIYPYGISVSAEGVRAGLDALFIRREGSRYVNKPGDTVINWGCHGEPRVLHGCKVINSFNSVATASSKLKTFSALQAADVPTMEVTRDKAEATSWLQKSKVVGRDLDRGSQGRGIVVYSKGDKIDKNHLFYTKYFKKEREVRIHVVNGKVIFEQEKLRKNGTAEAGTLDKYIRSHDRGWCFAFKHLADNPIPQSCRDVALAAVKACGLDFGAVDIGWNKRSGAAVFEINTAPGIEETSLEAYIKAFQ